MGLDLRGIRSRLRWRLERLRWRVEDAKIEMLKRGVELLHDKTLNAKLEVGLQEMAPQIKEKHKQALYTSVGQALSHWGAIEDSLVTIASLLLRTHEANKVGIVMYSIINFSIWLSIIDELFLQESLYISLKKPKWNKINERLRGLKDTRDRLAHHMVHYGVDAATFAGDTSLRPARFDTRLKSQKYQPLDFDQISEFMQSVGITIENLTSLIKAMTDLLTHETSQRKSSEQGSDQNHL